MIRKTQPNLFSLLQGLCDDPRNPPGTFDYLLKWLAWSFLRPTRMHRILVIDAGSHGPLVRSALLGFLHCVDGPALDFSSEQGVWFGRRHVLTDYTDESLEWIEQMLAADPIMFRNNSRPEHWRSEPNVWSIATVADGLPDDIDDLTQRRLFVLRLSLDGSERMLGAHRVGYERDIEALMAHLRTIDLSDFHSHAAPPGAEVSS